MEDKRKPKNKFWFTISTMARINTRRFFRDKLALFFGIAFPLIFLFVFGGIFGGQGGNVSFNIALLNESDSQFASQFVKDIKKEDTFKVSEDITKLDDARDQMSRGQLDATVVLPKNFGEVTPQSTTPSGEAQVLYTQNNETAGQTLVSILNGVFEGINSKFVDETVPFTVEGKALTDKSLSQFDYVFSGLLGFSIIGLGLFGPLNIFPELKKMGILRRLSTTPLRVSEYFVSMAISQVIIGLISIAVMFAAAITIFDFNMVGNWFNLAAVIIMGIITILGLGLAIGGWAKNERQAAPLGNIVVFPMMFLSGTFFPVFLMPSWLQGVSQFLPLTPIIEAIRLVATEGKDLIYIAPQLGLIVAWAVVIYVIAFRVFRWE